MSCRIEVPGSWFAAGQAGGLSSAERKEKYEAVLAAFVFLHYNWQFAFLRPTIAEIVAEYKRVHGKNAPSEELSDEEGQEEDQAEEDQAEELSD